MRLSVLPVLACLLFCSCRYTSTHPIDDPRKDCMNDAIVGKWKLVEDTNKNNFYQVEKSPFSPYAYHVKFFDRGGRNRTYEADVHFSNIEKNSFLNVPYWEYDLSKNRGYFFLKILNITKDSALVTMVGDNNMRVLPDKNAVRSRITANLNKPEYYVYTFHFYKGDFERTK